MSRLLRTTIVAPLAVTALGLALTGCGGSSKSSDTATQSSSAAPATQSSAEASASAAAEPGTLAAACPQIDAVMGANPDADPAGTAKKLEDIQAQVTTPDADVIGALAAAYAAIAVDPNGPVQELSDSARALGAACETATTAPRPN